ILKPKNEGPAAYVFPGGDPRPGNQAELLRTLQAQGVEVHRATAAFTVSTKSEPATPTVSSSTSGSPTLRPTPSPNPSAKSDQRTFPAGSYIVRMDQPYSRI